MTDRVQIEVARVHPLMNRDLDLTCPDGSFRRRQSLDRFEANAACLRDMMRKGGRMLREVDPGVDLAKGSASLLREETVARMK